MSDRRDMLDPDADLDRLLDAERAIPAAPDGARERVYGRLAATLGLAGAGALAAASASATMGSTPAPVVASTLARVGIAKLGLTCLLGAVLGGGAMYFVMRDRAPAPVAVPAPAPVVAPPAVPSPPPIVAPSAPAPVEIHAPPPAPAPGAIRPSRTHAPRIASTPRAPAVSAEPASSLAAERALLDAGRASLAASDPAGALARVADHAARFPSGQLVEERELLHVRALAAAGRSDEARARGEAFRRRFPGSVYLPAIDATLQAPR